MTIAECQELIARTYLERDAVRPRGGTCLWFVEEVGELAEVIRIGASGDELEHEFADVFAWLLSLANIHGVDMERAMGKYASGCPVCGGAPCTCVDPTAPGPDLDREGAGR